MATTAHAPRFGLSAGGLAGVLGIGVPLIGVIVLPIWRFPATAASGSEVLAFSREHTASLQAMMITYAVGVTLWLVFGAAVWARMRASLPTYSMLTTCFAAGMISFVTLLLAGFTCFNVLVYRNPAPSEARLLYDLAFGLLAMSGMPTAAALAAYAIAVYDHRIFARTTGHLAAATAAAHVLLLLSFIAGRGFFSLEGDVIAVVPALLWIWIASTASTLTTRRPPMSRTPNELS